MNKLYPIDARLRARLTASFTYHAPTDSQRIRYQALRDRAFGLAVDLVNLTPPGREQSLALTKLEEVIMWANKAIACGEADVVEESAVSER